MNWDWRAFSIGGKSLWLSLHLGTWMLGFGCESGECAICLGPVQVTLSKEETRAQRA